MRNKFLKITLLTVLMLIFLIASCNRDNSSQQASSTTYTEYVVSRQNLTETLSLSGTVLARKTADVRPLVSGVVKKVHISRGSIVKVGDVLIEIDDTDYRLAYVRALQNYESAKLSGSKLLLEQRDLELQIAKRDLERCTVKSPIDGIVVSIDVTEGSMISGSAVVAKIVNTENFYVSANVDEIDYSKISIGQAAMITLDAFANMTFSGRVSYISREAQTTGGIVVVPIEIDLLTSGGIQQMTISETRQQMLERFLLNLPSNVAQETQQQFIQRFSTTSPSGTAAQQRQFVARRATESSPILIPGLSCQVEVILLNKQNVIVVPVRAVQFEDGQAYVTVKMADKVEKRVVKIGERTSSSYEITEGLIDGEIILVPVVQRNTTTGQTTSGRTILNPFTSPQIRR